MEENVILENRIPLTKRSQISAAKPKRPEVEMKYQFHSTHTRHSNTVE